MVRWLVHHSTTVLIAVICVVIFGTLSYVTLPREANPDISIPLVLVTTPYVGVSPEDVEGLVTVPLERELSSLQDVKKLSSTSAEGVSIVAIEFEPDVIIADAVQKVRDRVSRAKSTLPTDAEEPSIREINFSDMPIMMVTIAGPVDEEKLKELAEDLQDKVIRVPGVLEAKIAGGLDREIQVHVDPIRLAHYGLALHDVTGAIGDANSNIPGGEVVTGQGSVLVRTPSELTLGEEIAEVPIKRVGDRPVFVRDIARVVDGFSTRASYARMNGQPSVSLSISKRPGANIIAVADEVKGLVAGQSERWPEGVEFKILADQSEQIQASVDELQNNIITALILVVAVILGFMGLRSSGFVAAAIPLSMLAGFIALDAVGFTLNMIVLFSLILALGMLVDNAIVVVENIYRHMEMGKDRVEAAIDGTNEVAVAVAASTATTVAAFLPLVFWGGIMGEFMGFLPKTLIIVLLSSLIVAVCVLPVFTSTFMSAKKTGRDEEALDVVDLSAVGPVMGAYVKTLGAAISFRYATAALGVATLLITFVIYGFFNHGLEFFPDTEPNRAIVSLRAADGTDLETTDRVVREIEGVLSREENIDLWVAETGVSGASDPFSGRQTSTNEAKITIDFLPDGNSADPGEKVRIEPTTQTISRLRASLGEFPGVTVTVEPEAMGPPVGEPIAVEVSGDDFHEVGALAQLVRREMSAIPGVTDLSDNYRVGRPELQLRIDRGAAERVGVKANLIGNTVRTAVAGAKASEIRDGEDRYDIVVQLDPVYRSDIQSVLDIRLPGREDTSPSTFPVPISAVASYELAAGTGALQHIDQDLVVTIKGDVLKGFNENEVRAQVSKMLKTMDTPDGFHMRLGGAQDEQAESMAFLGRAFFIAIALILMVLVTQFDSLWMPAIILASVVLSLTGVLWGLLLTGMPFGVIMTGIGVISLAGVVVNNAIVLLDYVQQLEGRGLSPRDALVQAGLVRFRPVMLTAVTTVLGLIPMALGLSVNFSAMGRLEFHRVIQIGGTSAQMWGPMAVAVIFGLSFATVLTLIMVPTLYGIYADVRKLTSGKSVTPAVAATVAKLAPIALLGLALAPSAQAEEFEQTVTLEQAWTSAADKHYDLAMVHEQTIQAESLRGQAWAALSPKVVAGAAYTVNELEIAFDTADMIPEQFQDMIEPSDPMIIQPKTAWSGNLTVVQPLFSGSALPGLKGAYGTAEAARSDEERATQQIRAGVARTYYGLHTARARVDMVRASQERAAHQLELATRLEGAGSVGELSLLQAQVGLSQASRQLRDAEEGELQARLAFELATGLSGDVGLETPAVVAVPASVDEAVAMAAQERPDVAAAESRVRVARLQRDGTWLQWAPKVDASFSYVYNEATGFADQKLFWVAKVEGNWTLWDGGAIKARAKSAASQARAAEYARLKAELEAEHDVRRSWVRFEAADRALEDVAREVALAERSLAFAERSLTAGSATWLDVEQARTQLDGALVAEMAERMARDLAAIDLLVATGTYGS
ncbi:MAG: efflux RND transporter permease subunit [Proteobacteria bacterium]|nr:efflux RND transporter permease subunit [Pseudomonadota bacterium]